MLQWLKIAYYRLAAWHAAWRESARKAYIHHAVATNAVRVLLTVEGTTVTWPDPEAGDGLILEFVVRVPARRFPAGDDRLFVNALFAPPTISVRVDGRPTEVSGAGFEPLGRDAGNNIWAISITAAGPGAAPRTGSEVVLETGNARATFVLGEPTDETGPLQTPGVAEFVRRIRPDDFIEPQS